MTNDAAEGNLGTVTDEEWLEAHSKLADLGGIPEHELTFVWDPELDPKTLIDPSEEDEAPRG